MKTPWIMETTFGKIIAGLILTMIILAIFGIYVSNREGAAFRASCQDKQGFVVITQFNRYCLKKEDILDEDTR